MLNGRQLRQKFIEFNAQYFSNKLPPYAIRVVPHIRHSFSLGTHGICRKKRKRIEILKGLSDEEAISTLIHEMAHAATSDGHGMRWKRKMIRLREIGAPFTAPDKVIRLNDWDGRRVTKRMFRTCVEDVLCDPDLLKVTLAQVIKFFMRSYGGAQSVAEFKRKCPWAGAVFRDAKKEFAEYLKLQAELEAKLAGDG